jgi:voltage-gated potassium channel
MSSEKNIHYWLGIFNDFLIIPMLTFIIFDITDPNPHPHQEPLNLFLTISFFSEWLLGFVSTDDRKSYMKSIEKNIDLLSCLPIGSLTKSIRLVRLFKVIKLFRIVGRAKRYQGPGESLFRLLALMGVTIFTGGYSILVVEPDHPSIETFGDALWWSMVTVSTVGYGDIVPETPIGRVVAAMLIAVGLGVCGYIAGFAGSLMQDEPAVDIHDLQDKMIQLEKKIDRLLVLQEKENVLSQPVDDQEQVQLNIKDPNNNVL